MKKDNLYRIVFLVMHLFASGSWYMAKGQVSGTWSGTISEHSKFTGGVPGVWSETRINISFTNNIGSGTYSENGEGRAEGILLSKIVCSGSGPAEFAQVSIDKSNNTYTIQTIGLMYICTHSGPGGTETDTDESESVITIAEEPWDNDPKVLKGSKTIVTDGGGGTKLTTTTTWNLVKQSDQELIITPQQYDTWLPEPGRDEQTPGPKMMTVNLELKDKNGGPASEKAKSFELRLNETSKEKGITINMPLVPAAQQLPDLRFQQQQGAIITQQGQSMTIYCPAGCVTISFKIACFDGGAWTTLTAKAILETDTIKGNLLVSGGEEDIRIPKRDPESNIAKAWLNQNGNPGESDDLETSAKNTNPGDGLSAYEEYRGVISEGQFRRLDPDKKELGVKMKKAEISLFSEGISKFENASDLKVIRFFENEISADRKLNKNFSTANVYVQYALFLQKGTLTGDLGKSFGGPAIPMHVSKTVIDQNRIRLSFQDRLAEANSINMSLSYTEKDLFTSVIAHELAHSVKVPHHGSLAPNSINVQIQPQRPVRIFDYQRREIIGRPYTITGRGGEIGNEQSGDVNCFMVNNALYDWAVRTTSDSMFFYQVPLIPLGTKLCSEKTGTGLNALKDAIGNYIYFGDAANGKCLKEIKLK